MTISEAFLLTGLILVLPATSLSTLTYLEGKDASRSLRITAGSLGALCLGSLLAAIWIGVTA